MPVCPLPFFSATAEPFVLKLAVSLRYGVGKTAKHFGTWWMYRKRFIARLRAHKGVWNREKRHNDATMQWCHVDSLWRHISWHWRHIYWRHDISWLWRHICIWLWRRINSANFSEGQCKFHLWVNVTADVCGIRWFLSVGRRFSPRRVNENRRYLGTFNW